MAFCTLVRSVFASASASPRFPARSASRWKRATSATPSLPSIVTRIVIVIALPPAPIALGECTQPAVNSQPIEAARIAAIGRTNARAGHRERFQVADDVANGLVRSRLRELQERRMIARSGFPLEAHPGAVRGQPPAACNPRGPSRQSDIAIQRALLQLPAPGFSRSPH